MVLCDLPDFEEASSLLKTSSPCQPGSGASWAGRAVCFAAMGAEGAAEG